MNSNNYDNVYCSCAVTVKNYLFALLGSIVLVVLSYFVFDFALFYAFLSIVIIIIVFYVEVKYANDYSFVHGSYLNKIFHSKDQKLVLTIQSIVDSNGYVTIADLEKIKRTIQQDNSIIDNESRTKLNSCDLIEDIIFQHLTN